MTTRFRWLGKRLIGRKPHEVYHGDVFKPTQGELQAFRHLMEPIEEPEEPAQAEPMPLATLEGRLGELATRRQGIENEVKAKQTALLEALGTESVDEALADQIQVSIEALRREAQRVDVQMELLNRQRPHAERQAAMVRIETLRAEAREKRQAYEVQLRKATQQMKAGLGMLAKARDEGVAEWLHHAREEALYLTELHRLDLTGEELPGDVPTPQLEPCAVGTLTLRWPVPQGGVWSQRRKALARQRETEAEAAYAAYHRQRMAEGQPGFVSMRM